MSPEGINQLKRHEGYEPNVYHCTEGKETIGFGYNMSANPLRLANNEIIALRNLGISYVRAEQLLKSIVANDTKELYQRIPWIIRLNEARQAVLINMAFNLGIPGLMKFKRTLGLIEHGDFDNAGDAMIESKWAAQVKSRAVELAQQMRTGRFGGAA